MSPANAKILVVDDEQGILDIVSDILRDEGYQLCTASNGEQARKLFLTESPDLVLLDIWMPGIDGVSLLREWQASGALNIPVIMMSGHGTIETAIEATRLGAFDFIEKPLSMGRLLLAVKHALRNYTASRPHASVPQSPAWPIGQSATVLSLQENARRLAGNGGCIVLVGEYGSGRRFWARYIHTLRQGKPDSFISVDANQLRFDNSLNDLLVQHDGMTIYIENAHRLPSEQLLYLASACVTGSASAASEGVDWMNRLLLGFAEQVFEKLCQQDGMQYFRFEAPRLDVPPIRARSEDVPDLLNSFVNRLVSEQGLVFRKFSVAAMNRLRYYDWPGNLVEMKRLVQQLLLTGNEAEISGAELEHLLQQAENQDAAMETWFEMPLREARENFEREYLKYYLQRHNGNVGRVANIIGVERTHLYRKLKSLGLASGSRRG